MRRRKHVLQVIVKTEDCAQLAGVGTSATVLEPDSKDQLVLIQSLVQLATVMVGFARFCRVEDIFAIVGKQVLADQLVMVVSLRSPLNFQYVCVSILRVSIYFYRTSNVPFTSPNSIFYEISNRLNYLPYIFLFTF